MPTYRRFTCVERSIYCFLSQQTYIDTELIICNTDIDYPLILDDSFSPEEKSKIKIFNSNIDQITGLPYTSTGAIRRDGVNRSTGNFYITWDDDDIFFPWNIQQCYDGIIRTGSRGWKPNKNIMWWKEKPSLEKNVLEATVIMYKEEAVFADNSGPEGMKWYDYMISNSTLIEDEYSIPSYCYYWVDPKEIGGHKQGNAEEINDPNNFNKHMNNCVDFAQRNLTKKSYRDYESIIIPLAGFFVNHSYPELVAKYVPQNYFTQ